jgi:hypothetical protein
MKRRTQWFLGAGVALVIALILEVAGQWSAALEVVAVAVILFVVGVRTPKPKPQT